MKKLLLTSLLLATATGCGPDPITTSTDSTDIKAAPVDNKAPIDDALDNLPVDDSEVGFSPDNFVLGVNNPYFSVVPGRKYIFDGRTETGEKIHKELLGSELTKEIDGVTTQAIWERQWKNDSLISDTKKWYAEDNDGNVWLFGADDLEIFGGYMKSDGQSWAAGLGDAKPGIVVPGAPKIGDAIAREVNGFSSEQSQILGVAEEINVPGGQFKDCLKIEEKKLGEAPSIDHAFYCKGSANLSQELSPDSFAKLDLTRIENNFSTAGININYPEFKVTVSEADAKRTALKHVLTSNEVTSITIELRNDDPVYNITVLKDDKKSETVYIDVKTGRIVA